MYLRLILLRPDEESGPGLGVFTHAYEVLERPEIAIEDWFDLLEVLVWYEQHLRRPDRSKFDTKAIFWFKADAGELSRRAWDLARIVGAYGPKVEVLRTSRPGYVVYEDCYQIAAVPFRDTFQARRKRNG